MNKALFKENMRRYWLISLAGCLLYFLMGPAEIIFADYGSDLGIYTMMAISISGFPLAYMLPAIYSVSVFSYLFKGSSCSVMHSMPFDRKTLYITNYVSGLMMAVVPSVLNAALLVAVRGIASSKTDDCYSFESVGIWLIQTVTIIFFVYSLCTLASMVSGNGVISVLTGAGFNALLPVLSLTVLLYAETYLYGFSVEDKYLEFIMKLHPGIQIFADIISEEPENFTGYAAIYCFAAAVISVAGYFVYKVRPLENAGDSYAFKSAKSVIGLLITFFISSFAGLLFTNIYDSTSGYMAFIIAALAGFIISRMIVTRSVKILSIQGLRELGLTAVIIVSIIAIFSLDFLGYEDRIPDTDDVSEAVLVCGYYNNEMNGCSSMTFTEEESIGTVIDLQRYVIENKDNKNGFDYNLNVSYKLKNGRKISRNYLVYDEVLDSYDTGKISGLKEYRGAAEGILDISSTEINSIYAYCSDGWEGEILLPEDETDNLIRCISDDMLSRIDNSFRVDSSDDFTYLEITCTTKDEDLASRLEKISGYNLSSKYSNGETELYFSYSIYKCDKETWEYVEKITG